MEEDQEAEFTRRQPWLGPYGKDFVVMVNKAERRKAKAVATFREETEDMTEEEKDATKGKSGMSLRHEFLLVKERHWEWFNILTVGLVPGGGTLPQAIERISRMK